MKPPDSLPECWDPKQVAVNRDPANHFLLRPGQIVAATADAPDVAKVLGGAWRAPDSRGKRVTVFSRTAAPPPTAVGDDPARDVLATLAQIRKATARRPQGPARVGPNHVFAGEGPITFRGEPRVQGGPGSSVRLAPIPTALPLRTTNAGDGKGVKIAVLDTGMFRHPWLVPVEWNPATSSDTWDANNDGYGDDDSGHGMFIAGLIRQVAPAAEVEVVKVLNSQGVGDDVTVANAMDALDPAVNIVSLSLGGYTDNDHGPLAVAGALRALRARGVAVVAAAGNWAANRPFWPAAFKQVVGVGAVQEANGAWQRASFSDYGWWVDATARGVNIHSTFTYDTTKVAQGPTPSPTDPSITFDGWASWDGTSFATPITAAVLARLMTRNHLATAVLAEELLLATYPAAPQPDFPLAVLVDEMEGRPNPFDS